MNTRKPNRLPNRDYDESGLYFVTMCTHKRRNLLGCIVIPDVGANIVRPSTSEPEQSHTVWHKPSCRNADGLFTHGARANNVRPYNDSPTLEPEQNLFNNRSCVRLSGIGEIINDLIAAIPTIYTNVIVDKYVIMPNHVHMIIIMKDGRTAGNDGADGRPTLSRIVKQLKGVVTKRIGYSPWQKTFHDHIIRNMDEYCRIAEYIDNNPATWEGDRFYMS